MTACALSATALVPALMHHASGQTDPVPSSRFFFIRGHGWGHAHGMSQDGAKGAADGAHLSASQIMSFYYPHTAAGAIGDPTMRILLQGTATSYADVVKPTGSATLTIHDLSSNYSTELPASPTKWRFTVGPSITISQFVNGAWQPYAPAGHSSFVGPINVVVKNPASQTAIRVLYPSGTEKDYYGYLRVARAAAGNVDAIAVMPMDYYLRGVVPRETPSSWPAAALQAQAIAARSYAEYEREHAGSANYDICDSTSCQVFGGTTEISPSGHVTNLEAASTNSAVAATAGQIRTYGGKVIFAQYSADDGGWTTDGGAPYLIAQPDPYAAMSGESSYYWSARLPASALESAYPAIGTLRSIRVSQRDGHGQWGGRVLEAQLIGSNSTVVVSGSAVASAYSWPTHSDGLRSMWWEVVPEPAADFDGNSTTDVSLWRPSTGQWFAIGHDAVHWGTSGDAPVPGDYDGNGVTDRAVWRPSTGHWYVDGVRSTTYGQSGDIPVPGTYNSDAITDLAVFRPANGNWYIIGHNPVHWGTKGDVPVPGDYDGDGRDDAAVFRPSTGTWYISAATGTYTIHWGTKGDIPVPADYEGDGTTDLAVWRPSTGRWYVDNGSRAFHYGTKGDIPVPADYDGDAMSQFAVFRPSTDTWYRRYFKAAKYGTSTDEPAPLPYAIYRSR